MGYYTGVYKNDCPRCHKGKVHTLFISVSPMTYAESCNTCGADDFNEEEVRALGGKLNTLDPDETDVAYD